jgi:hypothetical protein
MGVIMSYELINIVKAMANRRKSVACVWGFYHKNQMQSLLHQDKQARGG